VSFTPHVAWATTDSPVVVRMDSGSRLDAPVGSFGMFSIERVNVGESTASHSRNRYGPPEPQGGADGPRIECRFSSHLSTVAVVILRERRCPCYPWCPGGVSMSRMSSLATRKRCAEPR
jgi:hypothetical protein